MVKTTSTTTYTRCVTIDLPLELHTRLKAEADEDDRKLGVYIRRILQRHYYGKATPITNPNDASNIAPAINTPTPTPSLNLNLDTSIGATDEVQ